MRVAVKPLGGSGRESIPAIDVAKAKLEVAKKEEQQAINAANQYVVDNMGWLDMKDPSELQELNDAAAAATEKRKEIEREYYMNPDSFEDKVGDLGKFGRAAATVISKPFLALDVAVQTAKDAASDQNKVNTTSLPMLKYGQMSQARASVTEDMGKVGAWLTNAGLSIADSAYSRLLGLGTPVGTGLVSGVSASADKMYQTAQNGEDADSALVRGLVSGGISGASEGMSVGNLAKLLKKDGAKTVLGTMAKQGGFGAAEEGVDYVANYIADKAFKDPNAKFSWSELASNMASGGLSGAVFAGTGVAANRVNTDINSQSGSDRGLGVMRKAAPQQPTLAEQITTMQKQLADMQFQKQVDELAAVYEKNVGSVSKLSDENTYADWLHSIGADGTQLNSLAKYNEAKYNDFPEYKVLSQYAKDVESGWISPLSGFENYRTLHQQVQDEVIGGMAANGTLITGQVPHFMQRVIGTTVDPKILKENLQVIRRSGVEIEDVKDAVFSPERIGDVMVRKSGQRSIKFVGRKCAVTINPDTGELIQTNPLGD